MRYRLTIEFEAPESEGDPRRLKAVNKVVGYAMRKLARYDVDVSGVRRADQMKITINPDEYQSSNGAAISKIVAIYRQT